MRHVEKALYKYHELQYPNLPTTHIMIKDTEDIKGVAPTISFTIQSDPVKEVGVNGVQAVDILEYVKCLFESLNDSFPCRENALTITKIDEALHCQDHRTNDRLRREVEGHNKA